MMMMMMIVALLSSVCDDVNTQHTCPPPTIGASDLATSTDGCTNALVIGISCGLSAPYVAGMLDYAMNDETGKYTVGDMLHTV